MFQNVTEALSGLLLGIISGTGAFFIVMLFSFVYRYFTTERLPSFIGIVFGLGFLGFSGGLLSILEQPTFGGVIEIVAVTILIVWGVNTGDKIAEKIPKRTSSLLEGFGRKKGTYSLVKLPPAELIRDIAAKRRVSNYLKSELSEREFLLPSDLPIQEISQRIKKRLITDWGIGDAQLEVDQNGKVIYMAISAKEEGLSAVIPKGKFALPLECEVIPANLFAGDVVKIFLNDNQVIDETEVISVDNDKKVVTIAVSSDMIDKILGKKALLVVAISVIKQELKPISVQHKSGLLEEFQIEKILASLGEIGITQEVAKDLVMKVKTRLLKVEGLISTDLIKLSIIEELEKIAPDKAKKLKKNKFWK